jgi:hypothetical protein
MAKLGSGAKRVLFDFLVHFAFGAGLGALGDAIVEVTRFPVLNDTGTFGDRHTSNYEWMSYGLGTFGVVAGVADVGLGGKGVLGFTRKGTPFFAGFAFGTYLYEHTIVNLLGIRKFNPYEVFSHMVPHGGIIPGSFPHPHSMVPGRPYPGSQETGALHPSLPA